MELCFKIGENGWGWEHWVINRVLFSSVNFYLNTFGEKSGQNMLENDFYRRKKLSLVMLHCPLLFSCKARALKVAVGILS